MQTNKLTESDSTKETALNSSQAAIMAVGGHNYEVVDSGLFDEYYCSICHKLKRNAVELKCHHSLCSSCLDQWEVKADEMKVEFNCPQCRQSIDKNLVQYSGTINRIIQSSIRVKCTNTSAGCDWIGVIADIEEHIDKRCTHTFIKCTYTECGVYIQRKELNEHLKSCAYRPVLCKYCDEEMFWVNLKNHQLNDCRQFPVKCSNEECQQILSREKVHLHEENECSFMKIDCQFASVGCLEKFLRCYEADHEKQSMATHISLLLKSNFSVHKVLQATKTELLETKLDLVETKGRLVDTEERLKTTKEEMANTSKRLSATEDCLEATKEEVKATKEDMESTKKRLLKVEGCLKGTKEELLDTKKRFTDTEVSLKVTRQELDNLKKIDTSATLSESLYQFNGSTKFEIKLLMSSFQEDFETKLEQSEKMFNPSLKELESKVNAFYQRWPGCKDMRVFVELQSEALDIFHKYITEMDLNNFCKQHVVSFNLPSGYVNYLLKYVEVEHLKERYSRFMENHQSGIKLLASLISGLPRKVASEIMSSYSPSQVRHLQPCQIFYLKNNRNYNNDVDEAIGFLNSYQEGVIRDVCQENVMENFKKLWGRPAAATSEKDMGMNILKRLVSNGYVIRYCFNGANLIERHHGEWNVFTSDRYQLNTLYPFTSMSSGYCVVMNRPVP